MIKTFEYDLVHMSKIPLLSTISYENIETYIPVFHNPVIVVIASTIADHENSMIEFISATAAVIINATGVELELVARSINRYTVGMKCSYTKKYKFSGL